MTRAELKAEAENYLSGNPAASAVDVARHLRGLDGTVKTGSVHQALLDAGFTGAIDALAVQEAIYTAAELEALK